MANIKTRKPPKTRRLCPVCEKETTFNYNKYIGHSECKECGARFTNWSGKDE